MREGRSWLRMMLCAGLVYGLGFHTYIAYRVTPSLIGGLWLYWLVRARKEGWARRFWAASGCFAATAALATAPLVIYLLLHPGTATRRLSEVSVFSQPDALSRIAQHCWGTTQMFFWRGDPNWCQNLAERREVFLPVAILFGCGLVMAVKALLRREGRAPACGLLAGWLVAGALPSVLSIDAVHALRSVQIVPPVFLLAAFATEPLYRAARGRFPGILGTCIASAAVLVLCWEPVQTYFMEWATHPRVAQAFSASMADSAAEVGQLPSGTAKAIAVPKNADAVYGGVPMFLQPFAYLTGSYTAEGRAKTGITFVLQQSDDQADGNEFCRTVRQQHPGSVVYCYGLVPTGASGR